MRFAAFTATDDDVREVLIRIVVARARPSNGLAHQGYGEILAALYLFEQGVPAGRC